MLEKYHIVVGGTLLLLQEQVNCYIQLGYLPCGGVSYDGDVYAQGVFFADSSLMRQAEKTKKDGNKNETAIE